MALEREILVYSDGSGTSKGNAGGWGYCVVIDGYRALYGSGGEQDTTNNRMELMAAIMGLIAAGQLRTRGFYTKLSGEGIEEIPIDPNTPIVLVADSEYVLNQAMNKHRTIANVDLVRSLQLFMKAVNGTTRHVRGHTGEEFNEFVDKLAGAERKKLL